MTAYAAFMSRLIKQPAVLIALFGIIVAFTAFYAGLSIYRHWHFGSWEDLAMFDQMLWNVREGRGLVTSISGNQCLQLAHHFFSEHVSPILYIMAWPAGLTSGPEALLVIQALVMALSAWPAARIVSTRLNAPWAGVLAALLWLSLPGLWRGMLYDFHMEAFEAVFLFAFWWALMKGRLDVWLWAVLYVACKEDAPLYLAFAAAAGGVLFHHKRLGFSLAIVCALYAVLAIAWIGPVYSASGHTLVQSRLLIPACGGIESWLRTVMLNPERWLALGRHLIGFGGLPLLGGLTLLPGMAAVGIMWLSMAKPQYTIDLHYSLTLYPLLFLAAVEGVRRSMHILGRIRCRIGARTVDFAPWSPRLIALVLIIGMALAWIVDGEKVFDRISICIGKSRAMRASVQDALHQIPPCGTLAASLTLAPHMARREKLNLLIKPEQTDWVAIRTDAFFMPLNEDDYNAWMQSALEPGSDYGFLGPRDSFVAIFQKGGSKALNPVMAEHYLRLRRTIEAETMHHKVGQPVYDPDASNNQAWQVLDVDPNEAAVFGYYPPLPAGRYKFIFRIRHSATTTDPVARLDVVAKGGRRVYATMWLTGFSACYQEITLQAEISGIDGIECRVFKIGKGTFSIDNIRWEPMPD